MPTSNAVCAEKTSPSISISAARACPVRNPVTISNAIKQPLTRRQIQALGGVALHGDEQVWSFNNTQPVTLGVKADNDTITDASDQTWTILSATLATIANRWDCVCRLNQ